MFKTLKSLRNKCLIFSTFLFLILVIYSCNPNDPDNAKLLKWQVLGKAGFSSEVSANSDIAGLVFDNTGTPYVAYTETLNNNKAKAIVMKYNGSSWVNVGEAASYPDTETATDMSLAIDKNSGTPYIAYRDMRTVNSGKATVMKYNGGSWEVVGKAGFSTEMAHCISLAIDKVGTPYIAYLGGNSVPADGGGIVRVMKYDGGNWELVGNDLSTEEAEFIRLAIDNKNTPYIVYLDKIVGKKYEATVMEYKSGNWVNVGEPKFATVASLSSLDDGVGISLAFDNNDIAYVAYEDADNDSKATVMKYDGTWKPVGGNAGFSTGVAVYISLALNNNVPYVVYSDMPVSGNPREGKATVMNLEGGTWKIVGNAGFSTEQAMSTSLAFYNNVPYVGYKERPNYSTTKLTVMKYSK